MITYREFQPSSFDSHLAVDACDESWLVAPCTRNRDSDCLAESNFDACLASLGGEGDDVQVHRFGHWANGWFEIILVRPDSPAATKAESIEAELEDYPVLDDDDFSEREMLAANELWASYRQKDRIEYMRDHSSEFEFRSFSDMLGCARGHYFAGYPSELLS